MDESNFQLALANISRFGDTDIFPFPVENRVFSDKPDAIMELLKQVDQFLEIQLKKSPPEIITTCAPHGYTGFRWATQIDPLWNSYFLSLVLSLTPYIEAQRIPVDENSVFSYRFQPDMETGALFNKEIGWRTFQENSYKWVNDADNQCNFVVMCDIADFYHRVSHQKLKEILTALETTTLKTENITAKIMKLLEVICSSDSNGLPIGGPAARILAEAILIDTDRFLQKKGVPFCRFVDDFNLFTKSYEEAHHLLNCLTGHLMKTQGLNLQKQKTQVLTRHEFLNILESRFTTGGGSEGDQVRAEFMKIAFHYDPYSETPDEDYEQVKADLREFDVIQLLSEELKKSRIHQQFSTQLLKSFNALDGRLLSEAFITVSRNFDKLYPIFPLVMITAFQNFERLSELARDALTRKLRELIQTDSHITRVELNAAFAVRVLSKDQHPDTDSILNKISQNFPDRLLIKATLMHIKTWRKVHTREENNLKESLMYFPGLSCWERRRLIIASYFLGDMGKQFRKTYQDSFSVFETVIQDWVSERLKTVRDWEVPL